MKALLICPDPRPAVALLAESCPLAVVPLLGKCLVEYWIEHLVTLGVSEIQIVASDRPDDVRTRVGDGTRWGLPIMHAMENCELSTAQASERYGTLADDWSGVVVLMDHLPGQPELPLFYSYAGWFLGLQSWIPRAQALERIGQCEVLPGVWVGLRARIDPSARLLAPCWLGDYVTVSAGAVIGPGAVLEDGVVVAEGARVVQSAIGPATFVGTQTRVENSLVRDHTLINWTTGSCLRVPDAFWISSLLEPLPPARPAIRFTPMKTENNGHKLIVSALSELSAGNSAWFREEVFSALTSQIAIIEIDLSETQLLDSSGLAALWGLYRSALELGIRVRLVRPAPPVSQMLELTQMQQFFGIDEAEPTWSERPQIARPRFATAAMQ